MDLLYRYLYLAIMVSFGLTFGFLLVLLAKNISDNQEASTTEYESVVRDLNTVNREKFLEILKDEKLTSREVREFEFFTAKQKALRAAKLLERGE